MFPLKVSPHERNKVLIALAVSGFGFFGFAVYPIGLELSVESTYPVAEATSSGVLMLSGYCFRTPLGVGGDGRR